MDKRILGDVVDIFTNSIDMTTIVVDEDLLGRTHEYCIEKFAEKEGIGGGKFTYNVFGKCLPFKKR